MSVAASATETAAENVPVHEPPSQLIVVAGALPSTFTVTDRGVSALPARSVEKKVTVVVWEIEIAPP